jgi:hypothetical protein
MGSIPAGGVRFCVFIKKKKGLKQKEKANANFSSFISRALSLSLSARGKKGTPFFLSLYRRVIQCRAGER